MSAAGVVSGAGAAAGVAGGIRAGAGVAGGFEAAQSETSEGDELASDDSMATEDSGFVSPDIVGHLFSITEKFSERFKMITDHMLTTGKETTLKYVELAEKQALGMTDTRIKIAQIVQCLGQLRHHMAQHSGNLIQAQAQMARM